MIHFILENTEKIIFSFMVNVNGVYQLEIFINGLQYQPQEEADIVAECYYNQDGILMRTWRPPDAISEQEWRVV